MALFSSKSKKRIGTKSKITELHSPYLSFKKPKSPFFKKNRRAKKNNLIIRPARLGMPGKGQKALIVCFAFAVVSGLIYLLFFSHFFDLRVVEIFEDGARAGNSSPVWSFLEALKTKNILFIQEKPLDDSLKSLYPEIKQLKIKKILPQKLRIEIEKFPIIANIINVVSSVQKKYLINSFGLLTQENIENHDLPYIKIDSAEVFPLHTVIIPQEQLDYIMKAVQLFEEKFGMKVLNAYYLSREREVHLLTEKYFTVWIDMGKALQPQMEKLKKALPKVDIYKIPLQYIDLRISGTDNEKVIYKKRNSKI